MQYCPRCKAQDPSCGFAPGDVGRQGAWCRACLRAATHFRAWKAGRVRHPFPIRFRFVCAHCGERATAGKPATYCSRACKDRALKDRLIAERTAARPVDRRCLHCGDPIPQEMRSDAKFCSQKCNSAAHHLKRGNGRLGHGRRREIERAAIIERDGARCHVCGKKCRPEDIHLDHLVPLAAGGDHSPENLAVACARCNLSRGARGASQLRLAT